MNDTERLNEMIENQWTVSGPVWTSVDGVVRRLYAVFAGESECLAKHEDPRTVIDMAIARERGK